MKLVGEVIQQKSNQMAFVISLHKTGKEKEARISLHRQRPKR